MSTNRAHFSHAFTGLVASTLLLCLGGCTQLGSQLSYYGQAVHGQSTLMASARSIDDWLADPSLAMPLRGKLERIREIRQFAVSELGLPDNGSYRNYADIGRPFVLWNVVASPALELKALESCFPVAGCVAYRGYYERSDAQAYADGLRRQGYDVQIAGVPAYSTLGWFNDPVLSTFIRYPDGEVARLLFHELAHQVVYVQNDSQFNESFAVAVEEAGVERWMQISGNAATRQAYVAHEGRRQDFLDLLLRYRKLLETNYASAEPDAAKLARKAALFQDLQEDYQQLKAGWGGYTGYDRWFAEPLSNAHLVSVATYHDLVPGFRQMLRQAGSLPAFYREVRQLAKLDQATRHRRLKIGAELPGASPDQDGGAGQGAGPAMR